jgi:hypothetical protein
MRKCPAAFITKMSEGPLRSLANAIFVPSGDQLGERSSPGLAVSCVAFEPSAFATQISPPNMYASFPCCPGNAAAALPAPPPATTAASAVASAATGIARRTSHEPIR